ncbi:MULTISPECIES: NAD(P)/FAD-dependent oxidoreductase [Gordonia]|uniref:Putative oxidoreductase n=1 Tax=Gordonia sihwensis NBRC 108236 TaxID=1223544 RepID=L7LP64_9ACTN|nr:MULTISPECIES: FAD-dependent oxidoreductase [Gordonia]AUH67413.1 FAD-binding oxidoreductase [Gordonia sp. YC-JH1]GAC62684.1 putative oxidoreductase [Gordonia sihwensis NBRC 108236]
MDNTASITAADFDTIVVGGGIAGVSIAYELAAHRSVALVERESTLAYHTTGRSAATFLESYGNATVRALTRASRDFFVAPPDIVDGPLVAELPLLIVAEETEVDGLRALYETVSPRSQTIELVDGNAAEQLNPMLRSGYTDLAMVDYGSLELDVHGLHQGFLRGLRRRGGTVLKSAGIVEARRERSSWVLRDAAGDELRARTVVNAAGAWCDEVAGMFGAAPIGIAPLRRTAFMVPDPRETPARSIAARRTMTMSASEDFYFKPDGAGFLCSPAEETPQPPSDAKPDDLEIARAIERLNEATLLAVRSVSTSWAGLRSFTADRTPVVGPDPAVDGLFWFAGQGGYGIQMAPALARAGASLALTDDLPADLADFGITAASLAPGRSALAA